MENIETGKTVNFREEICKKNIVIQLVAHKDSPTDVKVKALEKAITPKNVELLGNADLISSNSQTTKSEIMETSRSNIIYSKVSHPGKEKYIGLKITNLNDLKKATPRLKLPTILTSSTAKKPSAVPEAIKQKLEKYCRTCAGLKIPLVNIFSEKGLQMRLNQQIQHLEDIDQHDSLSTQMCMDCICDLKMSYKFFMQIKKAEMKLKSICNSLNENMSKSVSTQNDESVSTQNVDESVSTQNVDESVSIQNVDESVSTQSVNENENQHEEEKVNLSSIADSTDTKSIDLKMESFDDKISDSMDYDCDTANDSFNYDNDSIEEFDPQDTCEETISKNKCSETFESEIEEESKTITAYKYDESLNAYVKLKVEKNNQTDTETKMKTPEKVKETESMTIKLESSKSLNQPTVVPNILKRKLSSGNISEESNDSNKTQVSKLNIDLKELKIPKLNLQDSTIKKEEDGIMYVTAKGSKPNEMLLIKVKKMDKSSEKKGDKSAGKKKESTGVHRIFPKFDGNNSKGSIIDEQIEMYKKKRVEILGESAIVSEMEMEVEEPEIRAVGGVETIDITDKKEQKNEENELDTDAKKVLNVEGSLDGNKLSISTSEHPSNFDKLKQRWKDIKKAHDTITKDLSEDCSARLRALLKQKDEYIAEFVNYLKQRRIVVSRLKDEDIITLYEKKNNVTIDRSSEAVKEEIEEIDPFVCLKSYECDFCFKSFPNRDELFEHLKYHDYRIMHYCEDCKEEFFTHKAKRAHNPSCLQKLLCKYCNAMLESKGKKRQHEQKHCDDQHGQLCDKCGEKFKHQGTLDQHVKLRHLHLEKIFKCPQCPKRFPLRAKLTFHLKSVHTTSRPFLCEDCGSDFKNPASLRHHRIRKHQPTNSKKECTVCHKMVPVYSMSKHMHTHKSYSIKCPNCDKMFKNTSTLKQHLRIHEDQRQYKCDMCGVGFNRRDGLRLHLKVHEKTDSRGLKECSCQVCGEKFPNHSTLVIHRNRTHKDGRNYTCHICNRSMISTRSLEWHLSNIHNQPLPGVIKDESSIDAETKRVTCFHCNKTFKTEMILRTHVKNTHTQKEPVKCLDCDLMFTSEVRWKHHMMVEHNRLEGTLTCPHCPKRFVNQLRLKTHMISHSDERPHSCDLCGFMLKTKIQLIKHKQNRHSNERPLQCRYCSWRCKQVSALVCHERTHTNERPYSCSVCKQRFKYLGDKNKHERRHESLGGSGFKRIVTGRNTNKSIKKKEEGNSTEMDSEMERETYDKEVESKEEIEEDIETFDETKIVKLDTGEMMVENSEGLQQIYVQEVAPGTDNTTEVVVDGEETTVYTEEVTTGYVKQDVIAGIIDEQMLQPGTVVHLEQEDENGKIQVIPVMLSLPDLTDGSSEVNLATASIMYSTT